MAARLFLIARVNGEAALVHDDVLGRRGKCLARRESPQPKRAGGIFAFTQPQFVAYQQLFVLLGRRPQLPVFIHHRTKIPAQDDFFQIFAVLRCSLGSETQGQHQPRHIFRRPSALRRFSCEIDGRGRTAGIESAWRAGFGQRQAIECSEQARQPCIKLGHWIRPSSRAASRAISVSPICHSVTRGCLSLPLTSPV